MEGAAGAVAHGRTEAAVADSAASLQRLAQLRSRRPLSLLLEFPDPRHEAAFLAGFAQERLHSDGETLLYAIGLNFLAVSGTWHVLCGPCVCSDLNAARLAACAPARCSPCQYG